MIFNPKRFNFEKNLNDAFSEAAEIINLLVKCKHSSYNLIYTDIVPTSTLGYSSGDFIPKKTKSETGSVGAKYVIQGWDCVSQSGNLVWLERRTLTGG